MAAMAILHPMFLQYVALALFLCGAVFVALHEVLRRLPQSSLGSFAGPLPSLHDSSVARYAVATATIMTLVASPLTARLPARFRN
jgi:hypothetical protein